MKLNNWYWVYQIECIPSGRRYVGLTGKPNPCWRWSELVVNLRNGISDARLLQAEWDAYPDLTQWQFRALGRADGLREGRWKEAEFFLAMPEALRLNSPNSLSLSRERDEKIESMLQEHRKYREIGAATGVSMAWISRIKKRSLARETAQ
jgi:hypothetical protein